MNDETDLKPPIPIPSSEPDPNSNPNLTAPASGPTLPTVEETTAGATEEPPVPSSRTLSPEERQNIVDLCRRGITVRRIAPAVGRDRKTVRRVLKEEGVSLVKTPPNPGPARKLDPFLQIVREKAAQRLTHTRILREIRDLGYKGGRTILADHIRTLPTAAAPNVAKRRFETPVGAEMQVDWSVFTVLIAGVLRRVHALGCVLAYSRYLHLRFYRDERQSTLLEALARAFEAFAGVALRVVFDNMATVVLGRLGKNRTVLWHPRLLDFARHYGFEAFACRVRHPNRKGKDERIFDFAEKDLLRGSTFQSFEDLNARTDEWVNTIANRRIHGTTRLVPAEAFLAERDFLVRLPEARFAVHEDSVRQVGPDATISVAGTLYTIPHNLANLSVGVRLYAEHFEVLDRQGRIAFSRRYVPVEDKGKLQIDPTHYLGLPHGPRGNEGPTRTAELAQALLTRFPTLAPLIEGITMRMKSLGHIHLRALWRLAESHGNTHFLTAASRAQEYRHFSSGAVRRILERIDPLPASEPPVAKDAGTRARTLLGEVDPGSLDQYGHLDHTEAKADTTTPSDQKPNEKANEKPKEDSDDEA